MLTEVKIPDSEKQAYLNKEYPFKGKPQLTDKRKCLHCDQVFTVGDFRVFKDEDNVEYVCCPNAPQCDGTIVDWFRVDDNGELLSSIDGVIVPQTTEPTIDIAVFSNWFSDIRFQSI